MFSSLLSILEIVYLLLKDVCDLYTSIVGSVMTNEVWVNVCMYIICLSGVPQILTGLGEVALLINQRQDIERFHSKQVQCALVISEDNVFPFDSLMYVFLLLELEHMLHKELLQLLISVVDAQLLKAKDKTTHTHTRLFIYTYFLYLLTSDLTKD